MEQFKKKNSEILRNYMDQEKKPRTYAEIKYLSLFRSEIDRKFAKFERKQELIEFSSRRIAKNNYIDEFGVERKKVVKERKVDIVRLKMDDILGLEENERDYVTEIGHQLSIEERKDVAKLTGEMTQSLKNNQKEFELKQSFAKRNLTTGLVGYLTASQNKIVKGAGLLIGGISTKISQLSFNIGNFFGLDKDWYLTAEEKKIDDRIQREKLDEKEVKAIRAEAMLTVVQKSKNLTAIQKDDFNKVYQNLRLENQSQIEQVNLMNQKKTMIDKIKSPVEDLVSSTSLKKLARGAKKVFKYAMVSAGVISTKIALNSVVPFVGWIAGGAVGGSVREMVTRSSYSYDSWKKEIDLLVDQGKIGQAKSLAKAIVENNWLVGERVDYQKMSRYNRELAGIEIEEEDNYKLQIIDIKKKVDQSHNKKIGKSAAIGAAFGGVAGFIHTLGGILFNTPAHGEENLVTAPKIDHSHSDIKIDDVYNKDGSINFENLKDYTHGKILYNRDVKEVIQENPGYFANKQHLQDYLSHTGEGHAAYTKEHLIENLGDGENGVPDYKEVVSYEDGVKHVSYDYSDTFGPNDKAKPVVDAWVKTIPGDKGYAIIVDKNGVEHMATDADKLGQIVDNKGNVLSQYPGEPADLYNSHNSCENMYVAVKYYQDYDSMNKFMTNLGINPNMVVRGTDGQTISAWMMQNGARFNETNYDLMKWIVYRDPAGAKEVMDVICDETKNYHLKKDLYEYYLDIPKDSPRWEEHLNVNEHSYVDEKYVVPSDEQKLVDATTVTSNSTNHVAPEVSHQPSYMNDKLAAYLNQTKPVAKIEPVSQTTEHPTVVLDQKEGVIIDESLEKGPLEQIISEKHIEESLPGLTDKKIENVILEKNINNDNNMIYDKSISVLNEKNSELTSKIINDKNLNLVDKEIK